MNKKTPLLDKYKEWLEVGRLPKDGLCSCINSSAHKELLNLFEPSADDKDELWKYGFPIRYWGGGLRFMDDDFQRWYGFTPLRQTILLFMAAMNDEL